MNPGQPGAGTAADRAPLPGAPCAGRLLQPGEPPACRVVRPHSVRPVLLVCDHGSNLVPQSLARLGLPETSLQRHIALDIGAAETVARLSELLGATTVLANYSRLVIDTNRAPEDPALVLALSDGEWIPGNQSLTEQDRACRLAEVHGPYHATVAAQLRRLAAGGAYPVLIAIHSFTPVFDQAQRPWEVGVLWDVDPRVPVPLMRALRDLGVVVGDNEPYSGKHPADYTMDLHGEGGGHAHASIELRQDLVEHAGGAARWADLLAGVLEPILATPSLYHPWREDLA